VKFLLDTHILLGVLSQSDHDLPTWVYDCLTRPSAISVVSVASLWEITIKARTGKLRLTLDRFTLDQSISAFGIEILPITAQHALADLAVLPSTRDPFDLMLLAVAQVEGLRLLTLDRALVDHPSSWRPA